MHNGTVVKFTKNITSNAGSLRLAGRMGVIVNVFGEEDIVTLYNVNVFGEEDIATLYNVGVLFDPMVVCVTLDHLRALTGGEVASVCRLADLCRRQS